MITPKEIRRVPGQGLKITWTDGASSLLSAQALRINCPCAECKELRGDSSHSKPLGSPTGKKKGLTVIQHTVDEQTDLKKVWGVGTYAIGIEWGDGHATGIYTYDLLRDLGSH